MCYEENSVTIDATISDDTFLSQGYIPIRSNRPYRISCYAKPSYPTAPIGGSGISIRLQAIDELNNTGEEFIIATYTGSGWQQISEQGQFTSDEDIIVQARVKIQVRGSQCASFDNVVVEEMP